MAVNELPTGPLYVSVVKLSCWFCPPHRVDIVQMHEPWRRGRAQVLPGLLRRALVIGHWKKTLYEDIDEDFKDDLWLDPKWLGSVSTDDISEWSDLDEAAQDEGGL